MSGCQREEVAVPELERFLEMVSAHIQSKGRDYLAVIKSLSPEEKLLGSGMLQAVADRVQDRVMALLPEFQ